MEETRSNEVTKVRYDSVCVGIQHRPKVLLKELANDPDFVDKLTLVREPTNQYDPSAVMIAYNGNCLGYIPKDDTAEASDFLAFIEEFNNADYSWTINEARFMADGNTPQWFSFTINVECYN